MARHKYPPEYYEKQLAQALVEVNRATSPAQKDQAVIDESVNKAIVHLRNYQKRKERK